MFPGRLRAAGDPAGVRGTVIGETVGAAGSLRRQLAAVRATLFDPALPVPPRLVRLLNPAKFRTAAALLVAVGDGYAVLGRGGCEADPDGRGEAPAGTASH
jgi:hypothetical protein